MGVGIGNQCDRYWRLQLIHCRREPSEGEPSEGEPLEEISEDDEPDDEPGPEDERDIRSGGIIASQLLRIAKTFAGNKRWGVNDNIPAFLTQEAEIRTAPPGRVVVELSDKAIFLLPGMPSA